MNRSTVVGMGAALLVAFTPATTLAGSGFLVENVDRSKNEFLIAVGSEEGASVGIMFNVYRDEEIVADIGNFKISTSVFLGRLTAYKVAKKRTIARLTKVPAKLVGEELDPVEVGDYVQPAMLIPADQLFEMGKSDLLPRTAKQLRQAVRFFKRFKFSKVQVEAHTDDKTTGALKISQKQAERVRAFLIAESGADEGQLLAIGYGDGKPAVSNESAEGRLMNRRIEIVIEK